MASRSTSTARVADLERRLAEAEAARAAAETARIEAETRLAAVEEARARLERLLSRDCAAMVTAQSPRRATPTSITCRSRNEPSRRHRFKPDGE
ncbi:hypothetical protein U703_14365 [Rhodobacter capsulatus YW1]|nr:hypothetical protein U703_14365 [Rhodobacter capsulatus YW1]